MKRVGAIGIVVLAAAVPAVALAHAPVLVRARRSVVAAESAPRAHLSGLVCRTAAVQADRSIFVKASMRPVTGTQKLEIRFELLSKPGPGAAYNVVPGGLGPWTSPSNATLGQRPGDVWIVSHIVNNLPAPATYRYRVSFRWTGAGGHVLATRTRESADCHQPLFHPDLTVSSISIQPNPSKPMRAVYVATIANLGPVPTPGPFKVAFTPGASSSPGQAPTTTTTSVPVLAAGATTTVTFDGPACTAATAPTVIVDPGHKAGDSNYANNSLTVLPTCPALTSAPPVPV